jgi:hypothetical protein
LEGHLETSGELEAVKSLEKWEYDKKKNDLGNLSLMNSILYL